MSRLSLEVTFPSSTMTVADMFTDALNLAHNAAYSAAGKGHQVEMGFVYRFGRGNQVHVIVEPGAQEEAFHDAMRAHLNNHNRTHDTLRVNSGGAFFSTTQKQLADA